MWVVGHGFSHVDLVSCEDMKPDMEIVIRLKGPEFGYVSTSIILIECAPVLVYDWTFSISIHSTINANLTPVFPSTDANLSRYLCVKEIHSFRSVWTSSRT
ncbi:hypothetical protein L1987_85324 [Smallanthus sonchifolius]|uniref:Uncharacterized protein n=1 Tax=Smallanthus sonchifolius TaxID=185202 RepID=A0ACB8XW56_9ASTR|nr:hypothetical protein L1987_85324 [Smallanthus sonchifolius]